MEFGVLGPLEVADHGRPVPVGGGKRRALLAILLLHANEVVSAERLTRVAEDGTLSRIDAGATDAASIWVGESLRQDAATGTRLWVATAALDQDLPEGAG